MSRTLAPSDSAIAFVSSSDALSTTIISTLSLKPSNACMQFAMFADSLRVVMTADRSMENYTSNLVGFFAMNSHANALYDSAPLERGSRNTTGVPIEGASETRTLRGISVS